MVNAGTGNSSFLLEKEWRDEPVVGEDADDLSP